MRVKNNTANPKAWVGQTIAAGEYYTIQLIELSAWQSSDAVILDISNGSLVVNDGTQDFSAAIGVKYLLGSVVEVTKLVEAQPFAQPTYRTKRNATADILSISPGTDEDVQFKLLAERYVTGGSLIVQNAELGDYITAEVEDVDGIIPEAYRASLCEAHPIISTYIEKNWVEVQGEFSIMKINTYPLSAKISAGLYLCLHYYAVNSGTTRKLGLNYHLTKKL
jgi:hypothetical protein